jgi:hypothetical protein
MKKIIFFLLILNASFAANSSECRELIDKMVDMSELKTVLHCLDKAIVTAKQNQNRAISQPPKELEASNTSTATPTKTDPNQPAVKKSKSGICHGKGTTYYSRTKLYASFDTIKACIDSGGRLPKR